MMDYKGYRAVVAYDNEAGTFHGEVVDTRDVITFEGASVERLWKEFRFSIDDYLAVCAERGRQPDKPFSGKIPLRIPPEVHRAATAAAKAAGKSLNAWLAETVEQAVRQPADNSAGERRITLR